VCRDVNVSGIIALGSGVGKGGVRHGGGSPFEWRVRVVVWVEQTAQLWIPRLRRRVEPAVERFLRVEDDGLSVVQPRVAAARSRRHDRERPERFGLACIASSPLALLYSILEHAGSSKPRIPFARAMCGQVSSPRPPRPNRLRRFCANEMTRRRESPSHIARRTA